jgi:DMATS type aromatic prenyltransferase
VGFDGAAIRRATKTLAALMSTWGDRPLCETDGWVSDIADDHSPIEFSLVLSDSGPEIRMMLEALGGPSMGDQRRAALELTTRLAAFPGVDLGRFWRIADLFLPEEFLGGKFALWHSVCFSQTENPKFKVYFNPQARGVGMAQALVQVALQRLGFPHAWPLLEQIAAGRGHASDELKYFALDLASDQLARVKVYFLHHHATPAELASACRTAQEQDAVDAQGFALAMAGGATRLSARPPYTCHSFVEGDGNRPREINLYIPACAYAADDRALSTRVVQYMQASGMNAAMYQRALARFAHRPLDAGIGIHSYVAASRRNGVRRLTVYLSPELNCTFPSGSVPAAPVADLQVKP